MEGLRIASFRSHGWQIVCGETAARSLAASARMNLRAPKTFLLRLWPMRNRAASSPAVVAGIVAVGQATSILR